MTKLIFLSLFIMLPSAWGVSHQNQRNVQDVALDTAAIKAFAGCYEVNFHFFETLDLDPTSDVTSAPYSEKGLELVVIDEEGPGHIGLQHVLVTGPIGMKHWRQTWDYEVSDLLTYQGAVNPAAADSNLYWSLKPASDTKGQWRQRVSQVDDSPRFECSAAWVHTSAGGSYWECQTPSPLPRREFSQRSDYDVLLRRNRQQVTSYGWMHEQDNMKVLSQPYTPKAMEKGYDYYKRVDQSRCAIAQKMWDEQRSFWKNVRSVFAEIRTESPRLEMRKKANGNLWDYLFEMGEEENSAATDQATIKAVIDPFIVRN